MRVGKNKLPRVQRLAVKVSPVDAGIVDMLSSQIVVRRSTIELHG
jgi:hypothetical protein